jgi:catechol O-methyltransferase
MQLWRFLQPSALGFTSKNILHALIDKMKGAPPRPVQVVIYVDRYARAGDPEDVLRTMDRFAAEERWLMNVGPEKGPLIRELAKRLPTDARILELGAYSGYSSIMLASTFGPEARVTSIEIDEDSVRSSRANVEVAGRSDQINILHGPSTKVIPTLEGHFDMVFLDHWKDLYKTDLVCIEEHGLIAPGSIVVADNVGAIFDPGDYLDYVRNCGNYESEHREATIEYTTLADAVEISVFRPRAAVPTSSD